MFTHNFLERKKQEGREVEGYGRISLPQARGSTKEEPQDIPALDPGVDAKGPSP